MRCARASSGRDGCRPASARLLTAASVPVAVVFTGLGLSVVGERKVVGLRHRLGVGRGQDVVAAIGYLDFWVTTARGLLRPGGCMS